MPRSLAAALLLALPLVGCGRAPSTNNEANAEQVAPANNFAEALKTMPEGQRQATLYRAISDAKQPCQQVNAVQDVAPVNGNPAWAATCDTGQIWIVSVGADGTAKVIGPAAPPKGD